MPAHAPADGADARAVDAKPREVARAIDGIRARSSIWRRQPHECSGSLLPSRPGQITANRPFPGRLAQSLRVRRGSDAAAVRRDHERERRRRPGRPELGRQDHDRRPRHAVVGAVAHRPLANGVGHRDRARRTSSGSARARDRAAPTANRPTACRPFYRCRPSAASVDESSRFPCRGRGRVGRRTGTVPVIVPNRRLRTIVTELAHVSPLGRHAARPAPPRTRPAPGPPSAGPARVGRLSPRLPRRLSPAASSAPTATPPRSLR